MDYNKSSLILLKLLYVIFLPDLQAEKIRVLPKVTGYIGLDVTLPCNPIRENDQISQIQWTLQQPGSQEINIIVSNGNAEVPANDTFLKDRVEISKQSLVIRDVEMKDAGAYTCILATFPGGIIRGTTNLVVQEQMLLSTGEISAIVIFVILLLVILTTAAYLIFIRSAGSLARQHVTIDTDSPVRDVLRPSVLVKEQDVVYSDVKHKASRVPAPSSYDKHAEAMRTDDVTYSVVAVSRGNDMRCVSEI
ncbi:uncharacterized protein LOC117822978 isoform X1 [Xyrichtys novacula]|uniref:Uncharacterized protein LOC117822978 isoform X1 n=1 Tax=Xyrichtys novacula TaxID=13765 RepID=A0AAV1FPE5_XYRNO|nr:uncharacterized protein LOC117822978 isoform X1 [Xyrichtys novacula]